MRSFQTLLIAAGIVLCQAAYADELPSSAEELSKLGDQLRIEGKFVEAESACRKAVAMDRKSKYLHHLADVLMAEGKYSEARILCDEAIAIDRKSSPLRYADLGRDLANLAELLATEAKLTEASSVCVEALAADRKVLPPDHPDIARHSNVLAEIRIGQGRYAEAERLSLDALAIDKKALPPIHPDRATHLGNLAWVYLIQGRLAEAEATALEAVQIDRQLTPAPLPNLARQLSGLGGVSAMQGKYEDAESSLKEAVSIAEKIQPSSPDLGSYYSDLAGVYRRRGKYSEAESLYKKAIDIDGQRLGRTHPYVATYLNNLAGLYWMQNRAADAEPLYKETLEIQRKSLPPAHPDLAATLNNLGVISLAQGRYQEAEQLYKEALEIEKKALGPDHPRIATELSNLAGLSSKLGHYSEAEVLYHQALDIQESKLGSNHPDVAKTLRNMGEILVQEEKFSEANDVLLKAAAILESKGDSAGWALPAVLTKIATVNHLRALALQEKQLPSENPRLLDSLMTTAASLQAEGNFTDAEPLLKRAAQIVSKPGGFNSAEILLPNAGLARIYSAQGKVSDANAVWDKISDQVDSTRSVRMTSGISDQLEQARKAHNRALFIATNHFTHPNEFPELHNPIPDAHALQALLQQKYGWEVEVLENPTLDDVLTALTKYQNDNYGLQEQLFVYIAGHGMWDDFLKKGYVILTNSDPSDRYKRSFLSFPELKDTLDKTNCRHVLVALDICHGGTFLDQIALGLEGYRADLIQTPRPVLDVLSECESRTSRKFIAAGGNQSVYEGAKGAHSPLARKLLETLLSEGGPKGYISFSDLASAVQQVRPQGIAQIFSTFDAPGSDFFFVPLRTLSLPTPDQNRAATAK